MSSFYNLFSAENENEETLEHHGVLGMKWGIRRYQNYDGTKIGKLAKKSVKLKKHNERTRRKLHMIEQRLEYTSRNTAKRNEIDKDLKKMNKLATNIEHHEKMLRGMNTRFNELTGAKVKFDAYNSSELKDKLTSIPTERKKYA